MHCKKFTIHKLQFHLALFLKDESQQPEPHSSRPMQQLGRVGLALSTDSEDPILDLEARSVIFQIQMRTSCSL